MQTYQIMKADINNICLIAMHNLNINQIGQVHRDNKSRAHQVQIAHLTIVTLAATKATTKAEFKVQIVQKIWHMIRINIITPL